MDVRRRRDVDGTEPDSNLHGRRELFGDPHCNELSRKQHSNEDQLHQRCGPTAAGGELQRVADERHRAADGKLHRYFYGAADQLGVDVRGRWDVNGAEPVSHVHDRRDLSGDPYGDEHYGKQFADEDELHHGYSTAARFHNHGVARKAHHLERWEYQLHGYDYAEKRLCCTGGALRERAAKRGELEFQCKPGQRFDDGLVHAFRPDELDDKQGELHPDGNGDRRGIDSYCHVQARGRLNRIDTVRHRPVRLLTIALVSVILPQ